MKFMLDTCALIWLGLDQKSNFSRSTLQKLEKAESLYVSPVSSWEIALNVKLGRLQLPKPADYWFFTAIDAFDIEQLPLTARSMLKSVSLPDVHRDPADRFIIATALEHALPVVTGDHRFAEYGVNVIL